MTLGVARQTVPVLHVLPGEPEGSTASEGVWKEPLCTSLHLLAAPSSARRVPLQYSAFLHAFLAPKELAAVDALGGPGAPSAGRFGFQRPDCALSDPSLAAPGPTLPRP